MNPMTLGEPSAALDGSVVMTPVEGVVEVPVADEVLLWHPDRAVPLQLNSVATTIWWHLENTSLDDVARDVAQHYRQPVERVTPGILYVTRSLLDAGLLQRDTQGAPCTSEPSPAVIEHQTSARISKSAAAWLQRRAAHQLAARAGRVRFGVASNSAELHRLASTLLASGADDAGTATIRYHLVDAGAGPGSRYWLLSDTGLPLDRANSADDLLQHLALHVAELSAVQQGTGVPLRLGVLEGRDHAVAVQWDMLATRPVLEPALERLGYRIRSGQWMIVDRSDLSVRLGATLDGASDERAERRLPLAGIVGWFGPGSLSVPHTQAEWAWTLAMFGCASTDPVDIDRAALLETAVALAGSCRVESLTDAGPSALLDVLADISRSVSHG